MANPFSITPANPLQALMMGQQGYEAGNKMRTENERKSALQSLMSGQANGGTPDYASVANRLAQSGDLTGASQVATLAKSLAGPESTDEIKEYKLAQNQGFKGSFFDFKTQLKQAGATRINNSINTGEKAYDTALGKSYADRFLEAQKAGQNAVGQIATLDTLDNLTKDPNFYSGVGAERFALPMKQIISRMGGDPNAAASMETFRALSNKSVLDSMGGSLGTGFSNADRDFVVGQVANLANTPDGNRQLISISRKVAQRNQDIARLARDYASKNGGRMDSGFDAVLSQWAEQNPLFKQSNAPKRLKFNPATGNLE